MMEKATADATSGNRHLVGPHDGAPTRGFPGLWHKVRASEFRGELAILEGHVAPGEFIPPHTHTLEDEVSCVIHGEVTFRVGNATFRAPAGSYVMKPRGLVHAIWNATADPATIIEVHRPGGFEEYYDAFGDLPDGPQRAAAMDALQLRFGISMDFALAAEIAREHGLAAQFSRPD